MKKLIPNLISTSLLKIVFLLYGGCKMRKIYGIINMTKMVGYDYGLYSGWIYWYPEENLVQIPYAPSVWFEIIDWEDVSNEGFYRPEIQIEFICRFWKPHGAPCA